MTDRRPSWLGPVAIGLAFGLLLFFEKRRPLRRRVEPRPRRMARNLALAAVSAASVSVLERAWGAQVTTFGERRRLGLLRHLPLHPPVRVLLGLVLLDYTLWHWHRLNHTQPLLWRFHSVHHADPDLDVSTGLRFHWGELSLAMAYRALQLAAIGPDRLTLRLYQTLLTLCVLFQHSNLRLPLSLERALVPFVVTPRMHGIHHSKVPEETDSNWSSLLSIWDRLHGTLRLDVPQSAITIGLPEAARAQLAPPSDPTRLAP